ncbi:MAG: NifU-like protein involved in Fe-S cluster formation [Polaribacter sp.]
MSKIQKNQLYNAALKEQALDPVGLNKTIQATHSFEGYNASCDDETTVHIGLSNTSRLIKDISFETESCAIC